MKTKRLAAAFLFNFGILMPVMRQKWTAPKKEVAIIRTSLEKSAAGHFFSSAAEPVKEASVLFQHS